MKKLLIIPLLLLIFLTGCNTTNQANERKDDSETEVENPEIVAIPELEDEQLREEIYQLLLEEELQRGYPIFAEALEKQGKEVPSYEEAREYLKDFFLNHKDGKRFLDEVDERIDQIIIDRFK